MARIDLVTIVHPDDKRDPKFKYTFKAPSNSDIKIDDYVIADIKGKESLGKVVSVLEDIDEDSETLNYIRSVSTIGDQEIKPLSYKLKKVKLFDSAMPNPIIKKVDGSDAIARTNASLKSKAEKEKIYFSIDQQITCSATEMHHSLIASCYEYVNNNNDKERIDAGNVFFNYEEVLNIIAIIMSNVDDDSQFIDIKAELKKIL